MVTLEAHKLNGIDLDSLRELMHRISADPSEGKVMFQVKTFWKDGTRSETEVESYRFAGKEITRGYAISHDEPTELMGSNTAANPQELLMAAFNACVMATWVAACSLNNISLEKLEIETEGELDLRGFLGLDASVKPGYDEIHYTVRIKGGGTKKQYQKVHEAVMATSPNFWNLANPINLKAELVVE
jgi:uncharacterized OsmC-like protein